MYATPFKRYRRMLLYTIVVFAGACSGSDHSPGPVLAPVIAAVVPVKGAIGDPVTITGQNLNSPVKIMFEEVESPLTLGSGTEITTVVPPGAVPGKNKLTVITQGGESSVPFEVLPENPFVDLVPPTLAKSIPMKNFIDYPVLIYGNNLSGAVVTFNDKPAAIYTNNQTVITTLVPKGLPAGTVKIKVMTPRGDSNTIDFTVQGPPPAGPPPVTFSIVAPPPPGYVPGISNEWDCGLFNELADKLFVDLNTTDNNGNFSTEGRYEFNYNGQQGYTNLNYIEFTDKKTGITYAGQFSSKFKNPCILNLVLISSATGTLSICSFDRRVDNANLVCEK